MVVGAGGSWVGEEGRWRESEEVGDLGVSKRAKKWLSSSASKLSVPPATAASDGVPL